MSAAQGLMLEHNPRELRRMARRGHLMMLVADREEGPIVVAVGGITQEHSERRLLRIIPVVNAAEYGALAAHPEYGGNGYGVEITRLVAERYLRRGFLKRFLHSPEIRLFAMAALNNDQSNKMFRRIGQPIEQSLIPLAARDNNYHVYDITSLGERHPIPTSVQNQTAI
jgi:GNAT superfamily N-acetyltransferase